MRRLFITYLSVLYSFGLLYPLPLHAQDNPSSIDKNTVLDTAVQAIQNGNPASAIDALNGVFAEEPASYSEEHLSLAYWLGKAYLMQGSAEVARSVWLSGINALLQEDLIDLHLEIALMELIFDNNWRDDYRLGSNLYIHALEHFHNSSQRKGAQDFDLYLKALYYILPASLKNEWSLPPFKKLDQFDWTPRTTEKLVVWWRSRDPAPATRDNEALLEHLQRIAYAKKHYMHEGELDDRGIIFIRLGRPSHTTTVQFDKTSFRNKVLDRSLTINESDFPDNEFWYYDHIDDAAHYLFHNRTGPFRIGQISSLLPASVRSGLGASDRGKAKAQFVVRTLEEIYRQLSLYHQDFGLRYQDVSSFASMLDEAEIAAETATFFQREDEEVDSEENPDIRDVLANNRGPDFSEAGMPGSAFNPNRPDLFVHNIMARDKASDDMLAALRDEHVPPSRSGVFDHVVPLPLHIRSARFLDEDGTTRTEIYWAAPTDAFALDDETLTNLIEQGYNPDDYLILTSSVQQVSDYKDRIINHQRILVKDIGTGEDVSVGDRTILLKGDTGIYHLAIQWNQYVVKLDGQEEIKAIGPHIKSNVYRQDSILALVNDGITLEMSDLKPMILPGHTTDRAMSESDLERAIVYPASQLSTDRPLVLYFEIYNLTYGENDRTQYTIEYTIEEKPRAGLRLGRKRNARTSFESTAEGERRNTSEQLVLDLSDWRGDGAVDISVKVIDEHTGQQASRTIAYELNSPN